MPDPRDDPRWTRWNRWELFDYSELYVLASGVAGMVGIGSCARPLADEIHERMREIESTRQDTPAPTTSNGEGL